MKKSIQLILAVTIFAAASAYAQEDIQAKSPDSAYVQDSRGVVVRNSTGLCWHDGYWTKDDAIEGCDKDAPKPVEEAPSAPAPIAEAAPIAAPVAPTPTSEKVSFAADAFFDFNKSALKPAGIEKLDEVATKLQDMTLEAVVAVGHTDSIGSDSYNQKLSVRRAESVKAYLVSKGLAAGQVYTEGKGEKQPVADNKTDEGRAKNRRVEIEVVGSRSK